MIHYGSLLMQNLIISPKIGEKLKVKHHVRRVEIEECFLNRTGSVLKDIREEHFSDPPTLWFIAETHQGRLLKVVFVKIEKSYYLKTAFEPNTAEKVIYNNKAFSIAS